VHQVPCKAKKHLTARPFETVVAGFAMRVHLSLACTANETKKQVSPAASGPPLCQSLHNAEAAGSSTGAAGSCARRRLNSIPSHQILERETEVVRVWRKPATLTPARAIEGRAEGAGARKNGSSARDDVCGSGDLTRALSLASWSEWKWSRHLRTLN
jgi:hypothetical protein